MMNVTPEQLKDMTISHLEVLLSQKQDSHNKHLIGIARRIKKAADHLENGDAKKAEIVLLRMMKDML